MLENGELKRWYYEMQNLGYNYRITDIQCALAVSQMNKIDVFLDARRAIAKFYDQAFLGVSNITPLQGHGRSKSSNHIYVVSIDFNKIGINRNQFMEELMRRGIGSQVHYIPVVNHPYYQKLQYNLEALPVVKKYYKTVLSIPLYYDLSRIEVNKIVEAVCELLVGIKFDQNK